MLDLWTLWTWSQRHWSMRMKLQEMKLCSRSITLCMCALDRTPSPAPTHIRLIDLRTVTYNTHKHNMICESNVIPCTKSLSNECDGCRWVVALFRCLSSLSYGSGNFRSHTNTQVILSLNEWMNRVHLVMTKARTQFVWIIKWLRDFSIFYRSVCAWACARVCMRRCVYVRSTIYCWHRCRLNDKMLSQRNKQNGKGSLLIWADSGCAQNVHVYRSDRFSSTLCTKWIHWIHI